MWFGEWAISTNFDPTDAFLNDWADAQKWVYSKSAGWIVRFSGIPQLPRRADVNSGLVLELQT